MECFVENAWISSFFRRAILKIDLKARLHVPRGHHCARHWPSLPDDERVAVPLNVAAIEDVEHIGADVHPFAARSEDLRHMKVDLRHSIAPHGKWLQQWNRDVRRGAGQCPAETDARGVVL